jgi:hypothetical protein
MSATFSLYQLAQSLPVVRGLTFSNTPYFTGSVIENRLGMQVFRAVGKHLAWRLRKNYVTAEIESYAGTLLTDGVLVVPNFLHAQQFSQIREEVSRIKSDLVYEQFRGVTEGRLQVGRFQVRDDETGFPYLREYLQENPLLLKLAATVIKRPIAIKPSVLISIYRKHSDLLPDNDVENVLHADLHAPTVKIFYYLNDIDESNGAFVYAKRSHRLSLARLRHEYDMSIRTAKLKSGRYQIPENLLVIRGTNTRNIISDRYRRAMQIAETQICGKANTLVIANNMGFHRRGEFKGNQPRETILLNFRHLERCFH